jgi:hypothetical protein
MGARPSKWFRDASLALLRREDARPLIGKLGSVHDSELTGCMVAEWFFDAVPPGRIEDPHVWAARWPMLEPKVSQFLEALEGQALVPGLGMETMKALQRRVRNKWFLRVEQGNAARLEFPPENPIWSASRLLRALPETVTTFNLTNRV